MLSWISWHQAYLGIKSNAFSSIPEWNNSTKTGSASTRGTTLHMPALTVNGLRKHTPCAPGTENAIPRLNRNVRTSKKKQRFKEKRLGNKKKLSYAQSKELDLHNPRNQAILQLIIHR